LFGQTSKNTDEEIVRAFHLFLGDKGPDKGHDKITFEDLKRVAQEVLQPP
jgi:hypothetical protein